MRIIAGSVKGHKLFSPKGKSIRPTLDRVREAIFSIIFSEVGGELTGKVADLAAGTGALGIEALSRGARLATFVESDTRALALIRQNLTKCGFEDRAEVVKGTLPEVCRQLKGPFQAILCDPPYDEKCLILQTVMAKIDEFNLLDSPGLVIAQTGKKFAMDERYGRLALVKKRTYGETVVHIYGHIYRLTP